MGNIDCMSPGKCQILTFTRTIMRTKAHVFLSRVPEQFHSGSRFRLPLDTQLCEQLRKHRLYMHPCVHYLFSVTWMENQKNNSNNKKIDFLNCYQSCCSYTCALFCLCMHSVSGVHSVHVFFFSSDVCGVSRHESKWPACTSACLIH